VAASDESSTSSRVPLPEGTAPVAIGLLIAGLASYLFLKVGKEALGSDEALQPITSLWVATFALAPGVALCFTALDTLGRLQLHLELGVGFRSG